MITTTEQLEEMLSHPAPHDVEALGRLEGDLLILGAAGKMGPSLAMRAKRAIDQAGSGQRVMAVSRFGMRPSARASKMPAFTRFPRT